MLLTQNETASASVSIWPIAAFGRFGTPRWVRRVDGSMFVAAQHFCHGTWEASRPEHEDEVEQSNWVMSYHYVQDEMICLERFAIPGTGTASKKR